MTRDELIEEMARAIYAEIPNGGTVSIPTTSSTPPFYRYEYRPDSWDDAPDRHNQCREIAASVLAAVERHVPVGRVLSGECEVVTISGLEIAAKATAIVMRSK